MSKWVSIFIISLFLLRAAQGRAITPDFDSHTQAHNHTDHSSHITAISPEEQSRLNGDDDGRCKGLDREECLVRKTMVAHTDYIYTQHIND